MREIELRQKLAELEPRIQRLSEAIRRLEGERDRLLLQLTDNEGASSQRYAGVR